VKRDEKRPARRRVLCIREKFREGCQSARGVWRRNADVPIYFLYFHSIESALKAFLRAHNLSIGGPKLRGHHDIGKHYEECRKLGLKIAPADLGDIQTVLSSLETANEEQGLRYLNPTKSLSITELSWTRDVVGKLLHVIEPDVVAKDRADGIVPGQATALRLTFHRPTVISHKKSGE
jgi:hypothetical protein